MDLIVLAFMEDPAFWNYIYPVNLLCGICLLMGAGLQIVLLKKKKPWYLLFLLLLILSVSCEFLYQKVTTFDALLFVFIGVPVYLAFSGTLIGTFLYQLRTKVRHP